MGRTKWKNRSREDKLRIKAEQSGFPLADKLEAKLKSLPEYKRAKYLQNWIDFHRTAGIYDKDTLDAMWGHLYHAQKMNNLIQLPHFNGNCSQDFINFAMMVIRPDSSWPEEMKKKVRQSLSEIMGPETTFDPKSLPDDYVPSWKKKPDDFKKDPMREYNEKEAESPPVIEVEAEEIEDVKDDAKLDDWKNAHLERGNYKVHVEPEEKPDGYIGPGATKEPWEIAMNRANRKKEGRKAKKKKVKKVIT